MYAAWCLLLAAPSERATTFQRHHGVHASPRSRSRPGSRAVIVMAARDRKVVLGLCKYSHDSSVAVVDAETGQLLFAAAKERLTRRKHDGGPVGQLVEHALDSLGLSLDAVELVVSNNHHFRISDYEKRLPFAAAIGYVEEDALDSWNTLASCKARKMEISHHIAHLFSTAPYSGFKDEHLVIVMDGMGEAFREFARSRGDGDTGSCDYATELNSMPDSVQAQWMPPLAVLNTAEYGHREAESVYRVKNGMRDVSLEFKRFARENSPPELYNHGFENMDSLGAVYSRISSHIFGDWNACGKVQGLASYAVEKSERLRRTNKPFMRGSLLDGSFRVEWEHLASLANTNRWSESKKNPDLFSQYVCDAAQVQLDLETVVLDLLHGMQKRTGIRHVALAGGVALNSTMNGRIIRECGFEEVYISPFPGDEGIAIGCAMYGYSSIHTNSAECLTQASMSPYLGREYGKEEIDEAVSLHAAWLDRVKVKKAELFSCVAEMLAEGKVVAWFQGRAEVGARALGNRSILADPRNASMVDRINVNIKQRETFRPFAPSVLSEHVADYFEADQPNISPYMSVTVPVLKEKRAVVPAITHIDGTARLQTVSRVQNERFYRLIEAFMDLTGVPMLLNTSLNIAGEPIVETPIDCIRAFLASAIDVLVLGDDVYTKRAPTRALRDSLVRVVDQTYFRVEQTRNMEGDVSYTHMVVDRGDGLETRIKFDCAEEYELFNLLFTGEFMHGSATDEPTPVDVIIDNCLEDEDVLEEQVIQLLESLSEKRLIVIE
ncbi:Nodulation protein NolNO [Porphyridium purpureum]|uniref:Nodulation protein NolNO n=1 Tax=Porphyridium purpureum TaxID=35688 RepID=A0A5J4Z0A1_PORPP|nr:Nodulation protein NolNO [Porphyridium purpureum]|eukprot:POR0818..scf208_2